MLVHEAMHRGYPDFVILVPYCYVVFFVFMLADKHDTLSLGPGRTRRRGAARPRTRPSVAPTAAAAAARPATKH